MASGGIDMKAAAAVVLLASSAFAQNLATGTAVAPGCGPDQSKFAVNTENRHPVAQPAPGKALLYFLEDDRWFRSAPKPTTRFGIDGKWVGATHGNSYFYVSAEPGEHHLCASWQTTVLVGQGHQAAAAHFTAETGQTYYFRMSNAWRSEHGPAKVELEPLDSDEAQLLMTKFSFSASHPKN